VFKKLNKNGEAGDHVRSNRRGRSVLVAVLLVVVVLLSAGSGLYAGASFFAQQAPNVTITTTIFTTTTSWTTSTIWSIVTSVVYGVWTTVQYTTSTSTVTVTGYVTFGNTNVETINNIWRGYITGYKFSLSQPLTVNTLYVYMDSAGGNLKLAVYSDAGTKPGSLIVGSASGSGVSGWNSRSVTSTYLAAGSYWLVYMNDDNVGANRNAASGSTPRSYKAYTYGDWPASWPSGSADNSRPVASIYAQGTL
jgi:preprotein translocase subunit SecG